MSNKRIRTTPLAERRPAPEEHSVSFTDEQWAAVQALLSEQSRYRQSDMRAAQANSQTEQLAGTVNGMFNIWVWIHLIIAVPILIALAVTMLDPWVTLLISLFLVAYGAARIRRHGQPSSTALAGVKARWNRHWNE